MTKASPTTSARPLAEAVTRSPASNHNTPDRRRRDTVSPQLLVELARAFFRQGLPEVVVPAACCRRATIGAGYFSSGGAGSVCPRKVGGAVALLRARAAPPSVV